MSKAKIIAIKIVVFLLIIAVVLTISYFFHGLMYDLIHKPTADVPLQDIVEPEKPNNEDNSNVVAKELVSKTIVSEKYGTFEIPVNSMLLSNTTNNLIFADTTDFNYIFDKEIEKLKDNKDITAESTFVFKCKRDNITALTWTIRHIDNNALYERYISSGKKDSACYEQLIVTANYNVFECYESTCCKPKFYQGHFEEDIDYLFSSQTEETLDGYIEYLKNNDDELPDNFYQKRSLNK